MRKTQRWSLTELIEAPRFKRHFKEVLPLTRKYVTVANGGRNAELHVPVSDWTKRNRHWIVGGATEYAVAAGAGIDDLTGVCSTAMNTGMKSGAYGPINVMLVELSELLDSVHGRGSRWPQFARLLCALAEVDAARKSGLYELDWMKHRKIVDGTSLRLALENHYPQSVVDEIARCADHALQDFPTDDNRVYAPSFRHAFGNRLFFGEGDFVFGRCLLELKTSTRPKLTSTLVWQVFGYAALDHARSKSRFDELAIYNARYRSWWRMELDDLANQLGGASFRALAHELRDRLVNEASRDPTVAEH